MTGFSTDNKMSFDKQYALKTKILYMIFCIFEMISHAAKMQLF